MPSKKAVGQNKNLSGFTGASVESVVVPSGQKLLFSDDDDCILVFLGKKDITEKIADAVEPVYYLSFHDGRRVVSTPVSYGLSTVEFQEDIFYYLHVDSLIDTKKGFSPMKDFNILRLGSENSVVGVPEARFGKKEIKLTLPEIADLNYNRLNYPLRRSSKKGDKKE